MESPEGTRILNDSEIATLLHALRMMQENANGPGDCVAAMCDHFADAPQLSDEDVDQLCESINCDEVAIIEGQVTNLLLAAALKRRFPWLGCEDENEDVGGADLVSSMADWYGELLAPAK